MKKAIEFFGEADCAILRRDINHVEMRDGAKVIGFKPMPFDTRFYPASIGRPKTSKVASWAIHAQLDRFVTHGPTTFATVRMESVPTFGRKSDAQEWADALTDLIR